MVQRSEFHIPPSKYHDLRNRLTSSQPPPFDDNIIHNECECLRSPLGASVFCFVGLDFWIGIWCFHIRFTEFHIPPLEFHVSRNHLRNSRSPPFVDNIIHNECECLGINSMRLFFWLDFWIESWCFLRSLLDTPWFLGVFAGSGVSGPFWFERN